MDIAVVKETKSWVAVNKPPKLLSVPGRDIKAENLQNILEKKGFKRVYTVHRLDRDTSGLILFAKDALAQKKLQKIFQKREVRKRYWGLGVDNNAQRQEWFLRPFFQNVSEKIQVDLPLTFPPDRISHRVFVSLEKGKNSKTSFKIKGSADWPQNNPGLKDSTPAFKFLFKDEKLRKDAPLKDAIAKQLNHSQTLLPENSKLLWIEAEPESGRTHQIRVHLEALGMPLLCDHLYGYTQGRVVVVKGDQSEKVLFDHFLLHARSLEFRCPIENKDFSLIAPLHSGLERVYEALGWKIE